MRLTVVQIEQVATLGLVVDFASSVRFFLGDHLAAVFGDEVMFLSPVFQEYAPTRHV